MAGTTASVTLDDRDAQHLFRSLIDAGSALGPVFADIGEHLIESTQQRFKDQVDPEGNAWTELKEKTKNRKKRNKQKVLIESGDMMGSLAYAVRPEEVIFGTNRIQAATHQFGDDDRNIPARPFVGISNSDQDAITKLLQAHLDV